MKNKTSIHQIVMFQLEPDIDRQAFLQLTSKMHNWLKQQPGFKSYELFEGKKHWADKTVWASSDDAERGNRSFLASNIYKELETYITPDYYAFYGERVQPPN